MTGTTTRSTTSDLAELRAEVDRLRVENADLHSRLTDGDRQAALTMAQAQEVADSLIEESVHRVERMIRAARATPPYEGIDEILQLSKQAHEQLSGATATLARLIDKVEHPMHVSEPAPDPLTDRVPFQRLRTPR